MLASLHQDRKKLASLSLGARGRFQQFPGWQQSMAEVRNFLHKVIGKAA